MGRVCAVYGIYCRATGKWYVGASVDAKRRIRDHFYAMRTWGKWGKAGEIGNDFVKHGRKAFKSTILERVDNPDILAERERYWADEKGSVSHGYNVQEPGKNRHWRNGNG